MPGNVLRITEMLGDLNISQNKIADAISLDPILATRILRLANSAIFSPEHSVTNLPTAIAAIGNNAIREILMISGLGDSFGRRILSSPTGKEIWMHLLATAMLASDMCRLARMRGSDEAFSCGLLHDMGKLILLRADSPLYSSVLERATEEGDLSAIEREVFGFDHAQLGADACIAWNLPEPLCNMIRYHHRPTDAPMGMALTRIVSIADTLVHLKIEDREIDELLYSDTILGFGFSSAQFDALWEDVVIRLNDLMHTFN